MSEFHSHLQTWGLLYHLTPRRLSTEWSIATFSPPWNNLILVRAFMSWIKVLYTSHLASVCTNMQRFDHFLFSVARARLACLPPCCLRSQLNHIQFEVLVRLRYSKEILFKLYPDSTSEACSRCSQIPCNLMHMLWSCS